MNKSILIAAAALLFSGASFAGETPSAADAKVYFVNLKDGDTVKSPVTVIFGLSGMGVAPAGTEKENTGHHHLYVDRPPLGEGEDGADEVDYSIPADENHIHFGGGQTETVLDLPPGKHTLQMVLGDKDHIPHDKPVVSDVITITVE
ncbi:DUF4399 domain-containing protein [Hoeflea sp. TYP-13]|uniref:DUF4399 domain-containing protein n=1 Tax=Hoeflea sp. TYP-13 TaxID=3230023 RepID=UPI0034C624BA